MAFDHWLPRTFGGVPGIVWVPAFNCLGKAKEFKAGAKEYTSTLPPKPIPMIGGNYSLCTGWFTMNDTKLFSNNFCLKALYELKGVPYFHWYPDILI